jgi:Cu2+-containing amine oxidase
VGDPGGRAAIGKISVEYFMRIMLTVQITMEDLQIVESVVRKDPKVIEQCVISGIPAEDMHKIYCDRKSGVVCVYGLI